MHVAGVNADPPTFEHIDPAAVGNAREVLVSELSGQGHRDRPRRRRARRRDRRARGRAGQGARAPRLPVRGRRRLLRAADRRETGEYEPLFRLESWRVIAEKRADGRGGDRGDDQDLGRSASASSAPPRATARSTRSTARCAPRSASATRPARHQARQLQGPHPRRVEGDRRDHPRAARRLRRRVDRGARSASTRTSSRPPGTRWSTRSRRACCAVAARRCDSAVVIPLARPVLGEEEEQAVIEVLRSGSSRSARACRPSSRRSPRASARRTPRAVSSGTAALHLALRAVGRDRGRRGRHVAVLVRRLARTRSSTSAPGRCSSTSTR